MGLKQHWFYILLALAQGATHGAEIRRRVAEHTEGTLKLYPAMLYGSLEDLQDQGYIAEIDEQSGRPTGMVDSNIDDDSGVAVVDGIHNFEELLQGCRTGIEHRQRRVNGCETQRRVWTAETAHATVGGRCGVNGQ